ncbi:hypothetical protein BJ138DRAFT_1119230 [Hygrophoropsis aurantiaca]|uniref:Uncharacterized protein n=1 Tax=Hygrophoropsis aurantiaca TaxID=72124 RepID=A0ACB7ZU79_9AGAM|nr:hypothetical protein BJ138DRAFT_1119230 [Hygrophoropsis aurantiaca]
MSKRTRSLEMGDEASAKRLKPQVANDRTPTTAPSALKDPAAWDILYRLAHGDEEYPAVDEALRAHAGSTYNHSDWGSLIDRILSAEVESEDPMVIFTEAKKKLLGDASEVAQPAAQGPKPTSKARPRKRSRQLALRFLDVEAQDDEEGDEGGVEEIDDENDLDGFIADSDPENTESPQVSRGGLDSRGNERRAVWESVVDKIHQQHGLPREPDAGVDREAKGGEVGPVVVVPKTWSVRVPRGAELVFIKAFQQAKLSAYRYALPQGIVFVEAESKIEFMSALSRHRKDDVMECNPVPAAILVRGEGWRLEWTSPLWVRVRNGPFKGDIAYVESIDGESIQTLLVPRVLLDPSSKGKWGMHRALFNKAQVEAIYAEKFTVTHTLHNDLPAFKFRGDVYCRGLLVRELSRNDVKPVSYPTPDEIHLFADSNCDAAFVKDTEIAFSKHAWRVGDRIQIIKGELVGQKGSLTAIDVGHWAATLSLHESVALEDFTGSFDYSLDDLQRCFRQGDSVKVVWGVHAGKYGIVVHAHFESQDITFTDSETYNSICVPNHYAEPYVTEGPVPLVSSIQPHRELPEYEVYKGDTVLVNEGPHTGKLGMAYQTTRGDDGFYITFTIHTTGETLMLPQRSLSCSPPSDVIAFSSSRGYDVKAGDLIKVLRGDPLHQQGIVTSVDLSRTTLKFTPIMEGNISDLEIEATITNVMIERKVDAKALSLFRLGKEACWLSFEWTAAPSWFVLYKEFEAALKRSFVPPRGTAITQERFRTPSPSPPEAGGSGESAWQLDDEDRLAIRLKTHEEEMRSSAQVQIEANLSHFLFDETVCANLQGKEICVRFRESFGSNLGRKAWTVAPNRVASATLGQVAVNYMTKAGGPPKYAHVDARHFSPVVPVRPGLLCVVLKGERTGQLCKMTKYIKGARRVLLSGGVTMDEGDVCWVQDPLSGSA